jgi:hypothetical protein
MDDLTHSLETLANALFELKNAGRPAARADAGVGRGATDDILEPPTRLLSLAWVVLEVERSDNRLIDRIEEAAFDGIIDEARKCRVVTIPFDALTEAVLDILEAGIIYKNGGRLGVLSESLLKCVSLGLKEQ